MNNERLRIVTVAFNPGEELALWAESVGEATRRAVDVVIVDNGTDAETVDAVGRIYGAAVLRPGRNLGYGTAVNRGVKALRERSAAAAAPGRTTGSLDGRPLNARESNDVQGLTGADVDSGAVNASGFPGAPSGEGPLDSRDSEWIVVVNPDVVFLPGAIDKLIAAAAAWPRGGAFGPLVRDRAGTVYPSARKFPRLVSGVGHALLVGVWPNNPFSRAYRENADTTRAHVVDWLSGSCLLLRREAFDAVGGFDESYFMFFEDTTLGEQLASAGWQSVFVPDAEVVHDQGASWRSKPENMIRAHHRSAARYLDGVYSKPCQAPLRWALRAGLKAREELLVRLSRRGEKKSRARRNRRGEAGEKGNMSLAEG